MRESSELVLADEHGVFLEGLTTLFTQLGYPVLAAVHSFAELTAALRAFRPPVVLTELTLRDGDVTAIERLVQQFPETRVVVLTADPDQASMRAALAAGVCGYVHKTRGIATLLDVVQRVLGNEVVVEGSFGHRSASGAEPPGQMLRLASYLTPREQECLSLLTAGHDTTAIARILGVSTKTVRSHVQAVLTKLGVHSRLEAAAMAVRYQLVPPPPASLQIVSSRPA